MNAEREFDFEDFLEHVSSEFYLIHSLKRVGEFPESFTVEERKTLEGRFRLYLAKLMDKFGGRMLEKELAKRNYQVFSREAEEFLSRKEIREKICGALRAKSKKEILTEDNFIRAVTETMTDQEFREEFAIPLESMLCACIAHRIFEIGFDAFCHEK